MSFMCLFDPVPLSGSQVYDTPPMAMKGPPSRDGQEIYDTPPSVDKSQRHYQQSVILYSCLHSCQTDTNQLHSGFMYTFDLHINGG